VPTTVALSEVNVCWCAGISWDIIAHLIVASFSTVRQASFSKSNLSTPIPVHTASQACRHQATAMVAPTNADPVQDVLPQLHSTQDTHTMSIPQSLMSMLVRQSSCRSQPQLQSQNGTLSRRHCKPLRPVSGAITSSVVIGCSHGSARVTMAHEEFTKAQHAGCSYSVVLV
jgi:hypothetical protein